MRSAGSRLTGRRLVLARQIVDIRRLMSVARDTYVGPRAEIVSSKTAREFGPGWVESLPQRCRRQSDQASPLLMVYTYISGEPSTDRKASSSAVDANCTELSLTCILIDRVGMVVLQTPGLAV